MRALTGLIAGALLALATTTVSAAVAFPDRGLVADPKKAVLVRHDAPHHAVVVDPTPFDRSGPGTILELPSTDGTPIRAKFEALRADNDGNRTWIGRVDTEAGPQAVVITFGRDAVFGTIPQRTGPALELTTLAGAPYVAEARPDPPQPTDTDGLVPRSMVPMKSSGETEYVCSTSCDTGGQVPLIDVLVVYSAGVVAEYGSDTAVRTRIAQLEQITNQAWMDSDAAIEMRIVGAEMVSYPGAPTINQALDDLSTAGTALNNQVAPLRSQAGADLVTMLRDADEMTLTNYCGLAWINGSNGGPYNAASGYAVNIEGWGCGDLTFAHELGHNIGSDHDQQTLNENFKVFAGHFPYSRGHRAGGFATIMGYLGPGQTRLALLSNPRLTACQGQSCGIADYADNARSHSDAAATVSAYLPTVVPIQSKLYIGNAVVREGHAGTTELVFTICLNRPSAVPVTFDIETENGTASSDSDYVSKALTDVTLAPGVMSTTFTVVVNGDIEDESDETLHVWLRDPIGAPIARARATGTIENDDTTLTIADVQTYEDDEGSKLLDFYVNLSVPIHEDVSFRLYTVDGTALAPTDYVARNLTGQTIAAGATQAKYGIRINGDTTVEPDETFTVRVTNVVNSKVGDGTAIGTIRLDDTSIRIGDVLVTEGDSATVTVTSLYPPVKPVNFRIRTVDGTADAPRDYTAFDHDAQTLAIGQTSKQFVVDTAGDGTVEPDERLYVRLSEVIDAKLADGQGVVTIADDDLGAALIRTIGGGGTDLEFGGDARLSTLNAYRLAVGVEGDIWYTDIAADVVGRIRADGRVERMGGNGLSGATGQGEGEPAVATPLANPSAIAIGSDGTAYFVEESAVIRAILPDGTLRRIVGGSLVTNDDPAPGREVRLYQPSALALDAAGNLYYTETGGDRVRRLGTDGIVRTIAGTVMVPGFDGDGGPATAAHLNDPNGIAVDAEGRVYIADTGNHRIRVIDTDGTIRTIAGDGVAQTSGDGGPAASARVNAPKYLDVADDGTVYFTDFDLNVRRISAGGTIHTVAGTRDDLPNAGDGMPATSGKVGARDVAAGVDGEFFIAASQVRRIGPLGLPGQPRIGSVVAGDASVTVNFLPPLSNGGAPITGYRVESLTGIGTDANAYQPALAHRVDGLTNGVAYRFRVRAVNEFGIGDASEESDSATPTASPLPALSIDDAQVVESASSLAITVRLNRAAATTVTLRLSTVDDTTTAGADYTAIVNRDMAITAGNTTATTYLYLTPDAEEEADETLMLRLTPVSGVQLGDGEAQVKILDDDFAPRTIHTVAGNGTPGVPPDGALAVDSPFVTTESLAIAPDGTTVFVEGSRVRRLAADGRVETVAGTAANEDSLDGGLARFVSLKNPGRVAIDPRGHIYVAAGRIRRIAPDGTIHAVTRATAGFGSGCPATGPMPAAKLDLNPTAMTTDAVGNLYAAQSCAIWRIDRGGLAVPITGRNGGGNDGDGGLAVDARFQTIHRLAFAPDGSLMVYDASANRVRRIDTAGVVHPVPGSWASAYDSFGRGFVAAGNRIYRVLANGSLVAIAGTGTAGFSGDGGPALSAMIARADLAVTDAVGNVHFLDRDNYRLRRVGAGGLPGAPTIVSVTPGSGRANLTIGAPASDGGHRIREYVVTGEPASGIDMQAGTAGLARVLTGLENGRSHRFQVRARNDVGLGPPSPWTGWIKPGDALPPTLMIDDAELAEGADGTTSMVFTVRLSGPAPADGVEFDIATADGNARAGIDYVARSVAGLRIAAGATSRGFAVTINGDTAVEKDETFTVGVTGVSGATRADGLATGTIRNDDGRTLAVADVTLDEGDDGATAAEFVVTLNQPSTAAVRFSARAVDGSARVVHDFAALSQEIVIPAGETQATVTAWVVGDREIEEDETFSLELSGSVGASIADAVATATVRNDDAVLPRIRISDPEIEEGHAGSRNLVFDVTLSEPAPHPVSVVAYTDDYSAVVGSDYAARGPLTLAFPPGQTAQRFVVSVYGDTTAEKDEQVAVVLDDAVGALIADGRALGLVRNDDTRLSVADVTLAEGSYGANRDLVMRVQVLGQPSIVPVTFKYRTEEVTARSTSDLFYNIFPDFTAKAPTAATLPAGQMFLDIPLSIYGDFSAEPDQSFRFVIDEVVGATIADGDAEIRFLDDDAGNMPLPVVAGSGTAGYAGEYVLATTALNGPVAVAFDAAGTLYIAESSGHRIRRLVGSSLSTYAGNGTGGFLGDGGPATSARLSYPADAIVDSEGNLFIADTGNARIRRVATDGTITTIAGTGDYSFSGEGGPATAAGLPGPQGLAIGPDGLLYVSSTQRVLRIDADGTLRTVAGNGIQGGAGDGGPATAANLSNPGKLAFAPDGTLYIAEGAGRVRVVAPDGTISTLRGVLSPLGVASNTLIPSPLPVLNLGVPGGVAAAPDGSVYVSYPHRVVRVMPSGVAYALAGSTTAAVGGEEYQMADPRGLVLRGREVFIAEAGKHRVRKADAPRLPGAPLAASVTLGDAGTATLTVTPPGDTGTSALSYYFVRAIPEGPTVVAGTAWNDPVRPLTGLVKDTPYVFEVRVGNHAGWGDSLFTAPVTWTDGGSGPAISIADVTVDEGDVDGVAMFTVKLSTGSTKPVTFDITTTNGSALAPGDYTTRKSVGVTLPPGYVSYAFPVTIVGDDAHEGDEVFTVTLSNVAGAVVGDAQATGRIRDDDPLALSIDDVQIVEGDGEAKTAKFTVRLNGDAPAPVSYSVRTVDGTALAGADYVGRAISTQTIAAGGDAKTYSVNLTGDAAVEGDETFQVKLSAPVGAQIDDGTGLATIVDDDVPTLSIADVAIVEGNSGTTNATFTVRLSEAARSAPVTYSIRTVNGTAVAGGDFVAGNLAGETIPIGASSRTFTVKIVGDTVAEGVETFEVRASSVTGATIADHIAVGTIAANDGAADPVVPMAAVVAPAASGVAVRDDRVVLLENAPTTLVDVLANDAFDGATATDGSLSISERGRGEVRVDDRGTPALADDRIAYTARRDTAGSDAFGYRLCDASARCAEGLVEIVVRPALDVDAVGTDATGTLEVPLSGLRALPSVAYAATALVAPTVATPALGVDPTPVSPWDENGAGTAVVVGDLPLAASPATWTLLVDAQGLDGDIDLYVGIDADGDGRADRDEVRCTAAMSAAAERCELALASRPDGAVRYWVVAHNRAAAPQSARLELFAVPPVGGDGALSASGPASVPAGAAFALRIDWNDAALDAGGARVGYVRLEVDGEAIGSFPVRIDRVAVPAK